MRVLVLWLADDRRGRGARRSDCLLAEAVVAVWQARRMTIAVGEDFSDAVLTGQEWDGRSFERCDFTDADLRGLRTTSCVFTECTFTGTDLGESVHRATAFRSCRFERTVLQHSTVEGCTMLGSGFVDCRFRPLTVRETDMTLVGMGRSDLRGTNLSGIRFREANLGECDLRECDLREADLSGARLLGTRLEEADLRGARIDADGLVQAVLRGARVDSMTALAFAAAHGLHVD
ncbi:hypothetical protein N599_34315 [Saccharopolyspora erythraea D]|nr:pentapeptide repeat-containing protein [Saccharopolyspora erythraea]EQD81764.1 hypothetical protein N599_34315 [Saccharopolyspora erythraea D]